jgi:hypothetical protein
MRKFQKHGRGVGDDGEWMIGRTSVLREMSALGRAMRVVCIADGQLNRDWIELVLKQRR